MSPEESSVAAPEQPRREFIRHTIDVPLEVETIPGDTARREHSRNVSSGGLAFVSTTCPSIGDLVRLRIPTVRPPFEAAARVAWCRPEEDRYLVGVQFVDAAAAFRSRMVQQVCAIERYRLDVLADEGRLLTTQEAAAEWIDKFAGRFPNAVPADGDGGAPEPP